MSFRDKLKIGARAAEPKGHRGVCQTLRLKKIIICHWKRKTGANILLNGQVADNFHESVITKAT